MSLSSPIPWWLLLCSFVVVLQIPYMEASTRRPTAVPQQPFLQRSLRNTAYDSIHNSDDDIVDDNVEEERNVQVHQQRQYHRIQIIPAAWILEASSSTTFRPPLQHRDSQVRPSNDDDDHHQVQEEEYDDDDGMLMTSMMIQPPKINIHDMAHVLQFTSQLNAQIQQVCRYARSGIVRRDTTMLHHSNSQPRSTLPYGHMDDLRGGGGGMVRTTMFGYHREPYRIRSTAVATTVSELPSNHHCQDDWRTTSLSSSLPVSLQRHYAAAFYSQGPMDDLQDYLLQIHKVLLDNTVDIQSTEKETTDITTSTTSSTSLERTLMMLYLDRACSSSGTRGFGGHRYFQTIKLPYCTPSTVRYLCVTAMLVAAGTVRGDLISLSSSSSSSSTHDDIDNNVTRNNRILQQSPFMQSLFLKLKVHMGIPVTESQHRVSLMLQALSAGQRLTQYPSVDDDDDIDDYDDDTGIFVTPTALQEWKEQWESRFVR